MLAYLNYWWPTILLVIGISLLVRQFMRGRLYDMAITTIIFGGLFVFFFFNVGWDVLMPVLFTLGGIYIIFREWFVTKDRVGDDEVEAEAKEIDDAEHNP